MKNLKIKTYEGDWGKNEEIIDSSGNFLQSISEIIKKMKQNRTTSKYVGICFCVIIDL